jgi:hypothetical protein
VTQPAVSLRVRSLEQRLGTKLLERSGRRVEPIEAGSGSTGPPSACSPSRTALPVVDADAWQVEPVDAKQQRL